MVMLLGSIIPITLSAAPSPMPSLLDVQYATRSFARAGNGCLPKSIAVIQLWKAKTGRDGYVLFAQNEKGGHAMAILLNDTEAVFYDPNGLFIVRIRSFDLNDPCKSIQATPLIAKLLKIKRYDNERLYLSRGSSDYRQESNGVVMRVGDSHWFYDGTGSLRMNSTIVALQ
jgi:hypothetical protein